MLNNIKMWWTIFAHVVAYSPVVAVGVYFGKNIYDNSREETEEECRSRMRFILACKGM